MFLPQDCVPDLSKGGHDIFIKTARIELSVSSAWSNVQRHICERFTRESRPLLMVDVQFVLGTRIL